MRRAFLVAPMDIGLVGRHAARRTRAQALGQIRRLSSWKQPCQTMTMLIGVDPAVAEYRVLNPLSGGRYRIRIGGLAPGESVCSCPDFSTNDLGTCKHIEFALGKIETQRGAKSAFKRGFHPDYSEQYLDYAGARRVRFRAGAACSAALSELAKSIFDADSGNGLVPERYAMLPDFFATARAQGDDLRCRDDALGFIAEWRDAQERACILDSHYPSGTPSAALSGLLKIDLYPYQARAPWSPRARDGA